MQDTLSNLSFDNVLDNQQDLPFDNHVAGEEATGGASTSIEGPHNAHNNHHPPVPGESSTGGTGVSSFSVTNPPIPAPRTSKQIKPNSIPLTSAGGASSSDINGKAGIGISTGSGDHEIESATVKVCVTDADFDMDESIHLPPGAEYVPSTRKFFLLVTDLIIWFINYTAITLHSQNDKMYPYFFLILSWI